jgi:hypothetical protein
LLLGYKPVQHVTVLNIGCCWTEYRRQWYYNIIYIYIIIVL